MTEQARRVGGDQRPRLADPSQRRSGLRGQLGRVRGRPLQAVVAVVVLFGALVVAGSAGGAQRHAVAFNGGAAWLPSDAVGQVALLDGASAKVITQVSVGPPNQPSRRIGVIQSDLDAYVVDSATGTVGRISGATYTWAHRDGLLARGRAAQLFVGADTLYVLDGQAGVVTTAQAATLQPRGRQSLAARVGAGAGIVDGDGRLWVVDARTGDLVWFDGARRHDRRQGADRARSQLVLAEGRPALVDLARREITALGTDGHPGATTCLDVAGGDASVRVAGASDAGRVYASVGSRGVLMVADLAARGCGSVIDLAAAGHDLGAPVGLGDRVFVPDFTTGAVHVVDVAGGRLISTRRVLTPGRGFTLAAEGGFVFYNDAAGAEAGVIRADGTATSVRKYGTGSGGTSDDDTEAKATTDGSGAAAGTLGTGGSGADNGRNTDPGDRGDPRDQPMPGPSTAPATPPASAGPRVPSSAPSPSTARTPTPARTPSDQTRRTPSDQAPSAPRAGGAPGTTPPPPGPGRTRTTPPAAVAGPSSQNPGGGTPLTGDPGTGQRSGDTRNPPPGSDNQPPVTAAVTIEASTATATVGDVVRLRATGAGLVSATWSFGDNTSQATGTNVSHTWTAPGRYTVTASATLTDGRTPIANAEIVVTAKPVEQPPATGPTAQLALDPATGNAPLTVAADAGASTAGSNPITTYVIAWGDGSTDNGRRATHTYPQAGTYTVTVTVTDSAGRTATAAATVQLTAPATPPKAALSVGNFSGSSYVSGARALSASQSVAGSSPIVSYRYEFGDGSPGTTIQSTDNYQLAGHHYAIGTYQASVTVTDQNGLQSTATATVDTEYSISFAKQAASSSPGGTTWTVTISGNGGSNGEAIQSVTGEGLRDDGCSGYKFLMGGSSCTVQVDVPSGTPSRVITVRSNARNNPATYDVAR
ncbi:PKD domain-containing protein [Frankia umida]|nr:PKD domain-containing protein [Frankia umida]